MSATVDMTAATTRLEPALRCLVKNPGMKVGAAADKYKLKVTEVWAWLRQFNHSKPLLSGHVIDSVKARVVTAEPAPAPKPLREPAAVVRAVAKSFARNKPERELPPPVPVIPKKLKGPGADLLPWLREQGITPLYEVVNYVVELPAEIAASWLTLNVGNRIPSKAKIRRFAAARRANRWTVNGETLKFSSSGRFLDGQSRLLAFVEAGMPVVVEVRGNLPDASQQTMDVGEARKGAHMLEMLGEQYPIVVAPALRLVNVYEHGALGHVGKCQTSIGGSLVMENSEVAPLLARHAGLRASVGWCMSTGHKVANLMPPSEAAFFHYVFGLATAVVRDAFMQQLALGLGLAAGSPVYHLRERLLADRAAQTRMGKRERFAIIIKAWNAFFKKTDMDRLRFTMVGEAAESFPVIAGAPVEKAGAK